MKNISIDNGVSFVTPEEALKQVDYNTIVSYMDDDVREAVHSELAPCTKLQFLSRYLELSSDDLIIG